jgi:site-specific recombinase XerD
MTITHEQIAAFEARLLEEEAASSTIDRYTGIIRKFASYLGDRALTKEILIRWREGISSCPATANVAAAALNRFLIYLGRKDMVLKYLKVQRYIFRPAEKELTKEEYKRLVRMAEKEKKTRLARAIETICALGIRVSELKYLTVEALDQRSVTIRNKGKVRTILLGAELTRKLKAYVNEKGIREGEVFVTRSGRSLSRTQLWYEMKKLCRKADVEEEKVFPHNLRHLFALTYYSLHKDIVKLADLLGHSSVDTTRIYLIMSGEEHRRELDKMGLVLGG